MRIYTRSSDFRPSQKISVLWFNVYNRVVIDLMAYDDGGISDLDFELASRADDLARY